MPSNGTYACVSCRYAAKQTYKCPHCHEPMRFMGKAFKPPKRSNISQWRKVEMLVAHDMRFGYCSCHRLTRSLRTLSEAKNKVAARRSAHKNYAKIEDVRTKQIQRRLAWKGQEYQ
jgi:hypothetical protein